MRLATVGSALVDLLSVAVEAPCTIIAPENAAWVIFTSGSTGVPKGVVLSHTSFSTSINAHGLLFGTGPWTRAAQFAAYTFDVSISDIFNVLHHGGCICMFSEERRMNDLTEALRDFKVNYVNLTPTVVRLLRPDDLPLIKTVVVGGEPLDPDIVSKWSSVANVFNSYGPSECAIISVCYGPVTDPNAASNIGFPTGTRLWVTQASDCTLLHVENDIKFADRRHEETARSGGCTVWSVYRPDRGCVTLHTTTGGLDRYYREATNSIH